MRIAFIVGRYWPVTGGVQTLIRHVASSLAERHEVNIVADRVDGGPAYRLSESLRRPPAFAPFQDGAWKVWPIELSVRHRMALSPLVAQVVPGLARHAYGPPRIPMAAWYARIVGPIIVKTVGRSDVVHIWDASAFLGAAGLRAARLMESNVVITPFIHPGQWGDDVASRWTLRRADCVVGLLEADRRVAVAFGVGEHHTSTIGICTPQIRIGGGAQLRARHRITGPLVLFLGVRRPYKGYDLLLSVADTVAAAVPGTAFAFVGPGAPLAPKAARARVIDVGTVDCAERDDWIDAADLLCLPSQHEIFPMSFLEAWSAKTPVISSDLPALAELMRISGGGWTVPRETRPLAESLVAALRDEDERRRRGRAGHDFWLAGHTPEVAAARHERIYAELGLA